MTELIKWLITIAAALATIYAVLTPDGKKLVQNLLTNLVAGAIGIARPLLTAVEVELQPIAQAFVDAFTAYGPAIRNTIQPPVTALVREIIETSAANLTSRGESKPEDAIERAAEALSAAMGFGIASAAVTAAFEAAFPEKLNTLNGVGPMLAQLAGFSEVSAAIRDPMYRTAFGQAAEYHFNSIFRPYLPGEGDAVTWKSRRLLSDAQLREIFKVSGLKSEYEEPFVQGAFSPVSVRAMAAAFVNVNFPRDKVRSMMEFSGNRDQDIEIMLDAFELRSTTGLRNQYVASLMRSAAIGMLNEPGLIDALDDLHFSAEAIHLVRATVAQRKLEHQTELYRRSISEAYLAGTVSDADYVTQLEAVGITEDDAEAHYAFDSIKKQGRAIAKAEREAAQRITALQRAAMQAAIAAYRSGSINDAALLAALVLAGIDPGIAGFSVAAQAARRGGSMSFAFGRTLPRDEALLLRESVAVVESRFKRQLIDAAAARGELERLEIPDANARELLSAWAAQRAAPTKTGELL